MSDMAKTLLDFINRDLLRESSCKVDLGTPLFDDGRIDSLKILQLIAFVEGRTGGAIPERDIVMENFRSVRVIADKFLRER